MLKSAACSLFCSAGLLCSGLDLRPFNPPKLMLIVSPSFKLKSRFGSSVACFGFPFPTLASFSNPSTLLASCREMLKSNASLRSSNPIPSIAFLPSPITVIAKNRELSNACSTVFGLVYGAAANSWPVDASSRSRVVVTFSVDSSSGESGFGIEVSTMRRRAVKIWRLLLSAVQVEAW